VQVVDDDTYRRKGIATAMVAKMIAWAREEGWDDIRAQATETIPPLLDWTGMFSVAAYRALGFTVTGTEVSPELLEGVRHMRAGGHGDQARKQWRGLEHLSDEQAAALYQLVLPL